VDDIETLTELNRRFIEAFRRVPGNTFSRSFRRRSLTERSHGGGVDARAVPGDPQNNPQPALGIDQVVVHVDGDVGVVSNRAPTSTHQICGNCRVTVNLAPARGWCRRTRVRRNR
jgi:hypothetical protein